MIVRYDSDLTITAGDYYSQNWIDEHFNGKYEIKFKVNGKTALGEFYIRKKSDKLSDDDMKTGWRLCGYATSLSTQHKKKSTVTLHEPINYFMEEAMNLNEDYIGSAKDPDKEARLLVSLMQTAARGNKDQRTRKVRLFIISNLYKLDNPYFRYFNVLPMISQSKNGVYQRFYKYDKGDLHYIIEFSQLKPKSIGLEADENDFGYNFQDFRNELHYIKKSNLKNRKPLFYLTFDNKTVLGVAKYNRSILVWNVKGKIEEGKRVYSCSEYKHKDVRSVAVFKKGQAYKELKEKFLDNKLTYDKMETFINLQLILNY